MDCYLTFTEKNVADYLYSKDALFDDHKKELQEQGYFEND